MFKFIRRLTTWSIPTKVTKLRKDSEDFDSTGVPIWNVIDRNEFISLYNNFNNDDKEKSLNEKLIQLFKHHTIYDKLENVEVVLHTRFMYMRFIGDGSIYSNTISRIESDNVDDFNQALIENVFFFLSNKKPEYLTDLKYDLRFEKFFQLNYFCGHKLRTYIESVEFEGKVRFDTKWNESTDFNFEDKIIRGRLVYLWEQIIADNYYIELVESELPEKIVYVCKNDKTDIGVYCDVTTLLLNHANVSIITIGGFIYKCIKSMLTQILLAENHDKYFDKILILNNLRLGINETKVHDYQINILDESVAVAVKMSKEEIIQERNKETFNRLSNTDLSIFEFDPAKHQNISKINQAYEKATKEINTLTPNQQLLFDKIMIASDYITEQNQLAVFGSYYESLPADHKDKIHNSKVKIVYMDAVYKPVIDDLIPNPVFDTSGVKPTIDPDFDKLEEKLYLGFGVPKPMVNDMMKNKGYIEHMFNDDLKQQEPDLNIEHIINDELVKDSKVENKGVDIQHMLKDSLTQSQIDLSMQQKFKGGWVKNPIVENTDLENKYDYSSFDRVLLLPKVLFTNEELDEYAKINSITFEEIPTYLQIPEEFNGRRFNSLPIDEKERLNKSISVAKFLNDWKNRIDESKTESVKIDDEKTYIFDIETDSPADIEDLTVKINLDHNVQDSNDSNNCTQNEE